MNTQQISIGMDSFRKIRENSFCYIDKTDLLEKLLSSEPAEVSLFTRPRRFGKTTNMSMLTEFLDISKAGRKSGKLFEGLKISQRKALCEKWMHKYPVLFITLKDFH